MFHAGQFVQVNTPSGVNFRSGRAVDPANVVAGIPNGSVMQVVGETVDGWTNVLWGGTPGWVSEQFVQGISPTTVPTGTLEVTGSGVNIRHDPSLSSPVITQTGNVGDTVESAGLAINQYVAVAYKGQSGYISAGYVKQAGASSPLARTLPTPPAVVTPPAITPSPNAPPPAVTPATQTTGPAKGGVVLAGGILALALVIYFISK
jgi:uncharacterized protein YgiM (DUF1202 family)